MRFTWLALVAAALAALPLLGQQPPARPLTPDQLDDALQKWERSMSGINSLVAQCTRTKVDKIYQSTDIYEGTAKYLRVGKTNYASLELYKRGRRDIFEKFICSGNVVYEYAPQSKEIRVHDLPKPPPGQVADDNFISFLFGMKASEAKRRYQLTWVPPPAGDRYYYYIDVRPRDQRDKAEFQRARLYLWRSNFLPRQLWFEEPNGNEITWDFPQMQTNVSVNAREFGRPALPTGWQWSQTPRQAPARVIRQQQ
jgi:TIGR03009 family protein